MLKDKETRVNKDTLSYLRNKKRVRVSEEKKKKRRIENELRKWRGVEVHVNN
jgi:hypothetical protein